MYQDMYEDWLSDNLSALRKDFIEENFFAEFEAYTKQRFKDR